MFGGPGKPVSAAAGFYMLFYRTGTGTSSGTGIRKGGKGF
jgi:hypothetical protein